MTDECLLEVVHWWDTVFLESILSILHFDQTEFSLQCVVCSLISKVLNRSEFSNIRHYKMFLLPWIHIPCVTNILSYRTGLNFTVYRRKSESNKFYFQWSILLLYLRLNWRSGSVKIQRNAAIDFLNQRTWKYWITYRCRWIKCRRDKCFPNVLVLFLFKNWIRSGQ